MTTVLDEDSIRVAIKRKRTLRSFFEGPLFDALPQTTGRGDEVIDRCIKTATFGPVNDAMLLVRESPEKTERLRRILIKKHQALCAFELPDEYYRFVSDINDVAYNRFRDTPVVQEIMPKLIALYNMAVPLNPDPSYRWTDWFLPASGEPTDYALMHVKKFSVTSQNVVDAMNAAASALSQTWFEVVGVPPERTLIKYKEMKDCRKTPNSVVSSATGGQESDVEAFRYFFDPFGLVHIAFHEAEHGFQKSWGALANAPHLPAKTQDMFGFLAAARQLGNPCPASCYSKAEKMTACDIMQRDMVCYSRCSIGDLGFMIYYNTPHEITAHIQGFLAESKLAPEIKRLPTSNTQRTMRGMKRLRALLPPRFAAAIYDGPQ